jgi:hypothetical protein
MGAAGIVETYWDVQNNHVSYVTNFNQTGARTLWDWEIPSQYRNVVKYSTAAGLPQNIETVLSPTAVPSPGPAHKPPLVWNAWAERAPTMNRCRI